VRGRPSVWRRAGALEEARARRGAAGRPRYDFSALADDEVEALAALTEKAEAAGGEPEWTAEDLAVLARLEAKLAAGAIS
jgi:hypothetical protein